MQLESEISTIDDLFNAIYSYCEKNGIEARYLASRHSGKGEEEGDFFYVKFLINKKHLIKLTIPTARRTFPSISLGIGPEYIPIQWLVNDYDKYHFSSETKVGAIWKNMSILMGILNSN